MIKASEARRLVNKEMTEAAAKQLKDIEERIDIAIERKQLSCTYSGTLLPPVKSKLIENQYTVETHEENERGMSFTITTISF